MIAAIIVAFNPEAESFISLLRVMEKQVDLIVVIDNSRRCNNEAWDYVIDSKVNLDVCRFARMGENVGIGSAINIGASIALNDGAEFLLLSDQDSLPDELMVGKLVSLHLRLSLEGKRVGAVGPTYTDLHTQRAYPFQVNRPGKLFYGHRHANSTGQIETLGLITSGSLIKREVFLDVGPMQEDLFVDYVDVEWCFRARASGYSLFGSGEARMFQRMGNKAMRVWYLRWRRETQYSPERIYYRVRNHLVMVKSAYVPMGWKLRSSWFVAGVVYSHTLFGEHRAPSLKLAIKGVLHGITGKTGRLVDKKTRQPSNEKF